LEGRRLYLTAVLLPSALLMLVLYTITINPSSAILEEAKGIVIEVADCDTITAQSFGEIPFDGVDCQKINTSKCLDSQGLY